MLFNSKDLKTKLLNFLLIIFMFTEFMPFTSISVKAVFAEAPYIIKNIEHTSMYIQSASMKRGVREYVKATSVDGGVLTYAWFINTVNKYLDGSVNETSGIFGDNGFGDGNTNYKGFYGTQSNSSNILVAESPNQVGKYYVYCEITNTNLQGNSTTKRSKRCTFDVRPELVNNKPILTDGISVGASTGKANTYGTNQTLRYKAGSTAVVDGITMNNVEAFTPENGKFLPAGNYNLPIANQLLNGSFSFLSRKASNSINYYSSRQEVAYWDTTTFYQGVSGKKGRWGSSNDGGYGKNTLIQQATVYEITNGIMDGNYQDFASHYQDIATIPGKIYEFSFTLIDYDKSTPSTTLFSVQRSIFEKEDYTDDVINRFWDGTNGVSSQDPQDNGMDFKLDHLIQSEDDSGRDLGKYPYGLTSGLKSFVTIAQPDLAWNGNADGYPTDYFFDIIRNYYYGDAVKINKNIYDGITKGNYAFDTDISNIKNGSALKYGTAALNVSVKNDPRKNKFFTYNYNNRNIQMFLANTQTTYNVHGYVTIGEGDGANVFAWTAVSGNSNRDNLLSNIKVIPISKPVINAIQSYSGENSIEIETQTDYAYALIDVSHGYGQYIIDVETHTSDAAIDAELGSDNNWFTTNKAKIKFKNLTPGKTYRIIAIPKQAIQPETRSNTTPLDVLDTDTWQDVTISVPNIEGSILAGSYKEGNAIKGRITIHNAFAGNYYALLSSLNNKPKTDTAVKAWKVPDSNGEIMFDALDLPNTITKFYIITKPQTTISQTYEKAAYSPTETYQQDDEIPQGFSIGEKKLVAISVTISKQAINLDLNTAELTRTLGQPNDTLTITYDATYRGSGSQFASGTLAICYDKTLGAITGQYSSADLGGKSTVQLTCPTGQDCSVLLKFDNNYSNALNALAAPEELKINYLEETLVQKNDGGYDRLENIEYRGKIGQDYNIGLGTNVSYLQSNNTRPISLTAALDNVNFSSSTLSIEYIKHITDPTTTIAVQRVLTVPKRPEALTIGTLSENIKVSYTDEKITNLSGGKVFWSANNFTTQTPIENKSDAAFSAFGWTGNGQVTLYVRQAAIENQSFNGKISNINLLKRPNAPEIGIGNINVVFSTSEIIFNNEYSQGTICVWGKDKSGNNLELNLTIEPGNNDSYASHVDGNVYYIAYIATAATPKSLQAEYSTPIMIQSVDFGDIPYRRLGPEVSGGTTLTNKINIKPIVIKNVGSTSYYIDATYVSAESNAQVNFDMKNLFSLTKSLSVGESFTTQNGLTSAENIRMMWFGNKNSFKALMNNSEQIGMSCILGDARNGIYTNIIGNDINQKEVGSYSTDLSFEYGTDFSNNRVTNILNSISANIRVNVVKRQFAKPIIAVQTIQSCNGEDANKLAYKVFSNRIDFDIVLDNDAQSSNVEYSTDGGSTYKTVSEFANADGRYQPGPNEQVKKIIINTVSGGSAPIQPATTYDIKCRIKSDNNHIQSEESVAQFYTKQMTPNNQNSFVNYTVEKAFYTNEYVIYQNGSSKIVQNEQNLTPLFVGNTLTIDVKKLAAGNYPESEKLTFSYSRRNKPTLTVTEEDVYHTGTGSISSTTSDNFEIRTANSVYDGNSYRKKVNLFSGVYITRTPANETSFASNDFCVLIVPKVYNVRIKSASVFDNSIDSPDYERESEDSLYFLKTVPQDYNTTYIYPVFSRVNFIETKAQDSDAKTSFTGSTSVIGAENGFDSAKLKFDAFKAKTDENDNLALSLKWSGKENPIYSITIPAVLSWNESEGATKTSSIEINGWDSLNQRCGLPPSSEVIVSLSSENEQILKLDGTSEIHKLNYIFELEGDILEKGDRIISLRDDQVTSMPVTQNFDVSVKGTPKLSGNYIGSITYSISIKYAE